MATGIGNLPYTMPPVSPFDVITSQAENERIANIKSLADGTGIGDKSITSTKIDFATFGSGSTSTFTITGFSATTEKNITWSRSGDYITFSVNVLGTSNSSLKTVTLPFTNTVMLDWISLAFTRDNAVNGVGIAVINSSSAVINFYKNVAGDAFTPSGNCRINVTMTLKVA